jgi:hypothetical protein
MRLDELTKQSTRWYQLTQIQKKWLVQVEPKWCIDKAQANQTHKTHHGLNLEKNHHFFSYNILCDKWQGYTKNYKSSQNSHGILKFSFLNKLWILQLCELLISYMNFNFKIFKRKYIAFGEIFPIFYHIFSSKFILTFVFCVLKIDNQVVNLIPILFFCHNFYLITPNGECELISNIFTLRPFQWYIVKGEFKPSLLPSLLSQIFGILGILTPKVGKNT